MSASLSSIKPQFKAALSRVLHYINQNLTGDVSLNTLALVANYSPFHFQKIFLAAISETPKQYVMRLRLERAAHYLKVFSNLPIVEIGAGCGFSSPSVFSRAFKNYYGCSAEEFRDNSVNDIAPFSQKNSSERQLFDLDDSNFWISNVGNPMERLANIIISPPPVIRAISPLKLACVQTTLSHPDNISFAFKSLMKWATQYDIVRTDIKYVGVWLDVPFFTSPDKCRYIAGIELKSDVKSKKGIDILSMNAGKYANYSMKGNLEATLDSLLALNHKYLEEMSYEIADILCYEIFDECPSFKSYDNIHRQILVPVKSKI